MKVATTPAQRTDSKNARLRRMDLDFVIVFIRFPLSLNSDFPFDPRLPSGLNAGALSRAVRFDLLFQFDK
jgi:hypothetical protein